MSYVYCEGEVINEPVVETLKNGTSMCKFHVKEMRRQRDGEQVAGFDVINVKTFARTAEWVGTNIKRGYTVRVIGSIQSFNTKDKKRKPIIFQ